MKNREFLYKLAGYYHQDPLSIIIWLHDQRFKSVRGTREEEIYSILIDIMISVMQNHTEDENE